MDRAAHRNTSLGSDKIFSEKPISIGMVGMFGGMWGEFNPGCFMTAVKTLSELQKRFPTASIDLYSIHNKLAGADLQKIKLSEIELTLFPRKRQIDLLNNELSRYDALVFGADIIWGGDDIVDDNDIFFLNSSEFLSTSSPTVVFNAVHTFYTEETMGAEEIKKIKNAATRAAYVSVRTQAIQKRLSKLGIPNVEYCPDIVLGLSPEQFSKPRVLPSFLKDQRPTLGISIRQKLADETLGWLMSTDFSDYNVVIFPYSRQYGCMETVKKIKAEFGTCFQYIEQYSDPVESYQLIGEFDYTIQDTYHGIIASTLHRKPFISFDIEPELTSRKQQLLEALGVDQQRNIRLTLGEIAQNIQKMKNSVPVLMKEDFVFDEQKLRTVSDRIQKHFDTMATIIQSKLLA